MVLLCWDDDKYYYYVSSNLSGKGACYSLTHAQAESNYLKWLLDIAKENPNFWLPIDPASVVKIQNLVDHWCGIVAGGNGLKIRLPSSYIKHICDPGPIAEAVKRSKNADHKQRPKPVLVTRVGAAETRSMRKRACGEDSDVRLSAHGAASVFSTVSSTHGAASVFSTVTTEGAPQVHYQQGDQDFCLTYCVASALHCAGDEKGASMIASLAEASVGADVTDRVNWVTDKCAAKLQPQWRTLSKPLKRTFALSKPDLVALLATPNDVFVVQIEDSDKNISHCVAAYNGWLFDSNKPRAVPLDAAGLDACCLQEPGRTATFNRAYRCFKLERAAPERSAEEDEQAAKRQCV